MSSTKKPILIVALIVPLIFLLAFGVGKLITADASRGCHRSSEFTLREGETHADLLPENRSITVTVEDLSRLRKRARGTLQVNGTAQGFLLGRGTKISMNDVRLSATSWSSGPKMTFVLSDCRKRT